MNWSSQQAAFIEWCMNGAGSCVLEAVAGAGKTTVLLAAGAKMSGQVAYMAYNRKIVDETKAKLLVQGVDWKKMQANTAHGFAMSAYRKARPGVKVDGNKVRDIVANLLPPLHPLAAHSDVVVKLVSLAKQAALGVIGSISDTHWWLEAAEHYDIFDIEDGLQEDQKNDLIELAQSALIKSSQMLDLIDFDDMIYMALVHRVRFWQFEVIMVDEAQDTNAARRALVRAMLRKGGRVIAVGDRHQAIYGFTGADADSLDLITRDFNCERLPLTISYRCPRTVVAFAQKWVRHIEAAPTAPEGAVSRTPMDEFLKRNDLDASSAVLSRVTKPLVTLAFKLIRQRTPCRIEGKDIGQRIIKLMERWKVSSLDALEARLETHLARETTKLLAKKQEAKLAEVEDAVETVRVIIDQCRKEKKASIADAVAYVSQLFSDDVSGVLTLSTIHRAKGREWPTVFWLDRANTCPSKWARQEWAIAQEDNLCYVAATRAQHQLIELDAPIKKAA